MLKMSMSEISTVPESVKPSAASLEELLTGDEILLSCKAFAQWLRSLKCGGPFGSVLEALLFPRIVAVLDSSYVFQDLLHFEKIGGPTAFIHCLQADVLVPYAAVRAAYEVRQRIIEIPDEALRSKLLNRWESVYVPHMRFVADRNAPANPHGLRDSNDAPFVNAFDDLQAQTLIAWDPDLQVLELGPKEPHRFLIDLRHHARSKTVGAYFTIGGTMIGVTSVKALVGSLQCLVRCLQFVHRNVPWLLPAAAALVAGLLALPQTRQFLSRTLDRTIDLLGDMCIKAINAVETSVLPVIQRGEQAGIRIQEQLSSRLRPERLIDYAWHVLTTEGAALDVRTVADRVLGAGYKPRNQTVSLAYLRRVLTRDDRFQSLGDDKWTVRILTPKAQSAS